MNESPELFLKYAAQQVPRYTSYPTAPHFGAVSAEQYASWLKKVSPQEAISLYLHVPYCKQLCWFCGCHTQITHKYAPVEKYLTLLMAEMELLQRTIERKQPVSHLHFGGGSPTIISAPDFTQLMESIHGNFAIDDNAQMAIEVDPRTVSEAQVAAYAKYGINRVSLGVQDFDSDVQKAVNRVQPLNLVYRVAQLFRDYGISSINIDLIYGLPGQTIASIRKTMEYTVMLKPARISLFGYAHVPWKKKNISLIAEETLPDEQQRIAFFTLASQMLHDAGYIKVGLDHFVLPEDSMAGALAGGTLHRNFQGYTTDTSGTLLGVGTSAIGRLAEGYVQNTTNLQEYAAALEKGILPVKKGFALTAEDALRGRVIETLMCQFETDIGLCCKEAGFPPEFLDREIQALQAALSQQYISVTNRKIKVNLRYSQIVRLVCSFFDAYYEAQQGRHAKIA